MTTTNADIMDVAEQSFNRLPDGRQIAVEEIDGGSLVWADASKPGRELIGFGELEDRSRVRAELARRGLGTGAIHNLPVFEEVAGR